MTFSEYVDQLLAEGGRRPNAIELFAEWHRRPYTNMDGQRVVPLAQHELTLDEMLEELIDQGVAV